MQTIRRPMIIMLVVMLFLTCRVAAEDTRPNIILIVADDMGYSDMGSFGGEIDTPVMDTLAQEGMLFSNFHVLPTCSPTRSALLSGNDNHVAGMGVMNEWIYPAIKDLPGYAGHLNDQVATIPEILGTAGYHTYMAGKWHLGKADDQSPHARGFEETFTMMNGGGSHFADMKPLTLHEPMIYRKNGKRISSLPDDFYATKDYTDAMISFINGNKNDGNPFFAYLSYTAPHDPLHAPAEYIAKYRGRYDDGWNALSRKRLQQLKELGLVSADLRTLPPNMLTRQWGALTHEEKKLAARDMEVYAAMVDYMDMSIGRLFKYLKEKDLYENTLIIFFSDNGANGAHATAYPGNADGSYLATFNNELENRGQPNSFIDMGPNWAQAVSAPLRMFKSFVSQGGIKSPMIVKWPGKFKGNGSWNHGFLHVTDIMPTCMELAQASYPENINGRPLKKPIGRSMMPLMRSPESKIHAKNGMGYELFEMKAYIQNNWKLLRMPAPFGSGNWELYNLAKDPGETTDVSTDYPDKKSDLMKAWQQYARQNEVFDHKGRFDAIYRKVYSVEN